MRKIIVFTGSRADYGILRWVIKGLENSPSAELKLMAGGVHFSDKFGNSFKEILEDKIKIDFPLDFIMASSEGVGISKSIALAIISASDIFANYQPDLLLLLGDRYEALAIAIAATNQKIPIAHIHGGETTQGAIDEAFRHCLTKMSHLHFTATAAYRGRVLQLGESAERVFNVGAPGLDTLFKEQLFSKGELEEIIQFNLGENYFLITFHPETLAKDVGSIGLTNLFEAIKKFSGFKFLLTYPNADYGNDKIINIINEAKDNLGGKLCIAKSLGQTVYLSAAKHSWAVLGNSSSGIIEAPSLGVPTINIGDRQKGRILAHSVIQVDSSLVSISKGLTKTFDEDFRNLCKKCINPYGNGNSSDKIVAEILNHPINNLIPKSFQDIDLAGQLYEPRTLTDKYQ